MTEGEGMKVTHKFLDLQQFFLELKCFINVSDFIHNAELDCNYLVI